MTKKMKETYLNICSVPTKVVTYGKHIKELDDQPFDLILIIPGNPGVTSFYYEFMETLHEQLGYSVWILSHAGHEYDKNNSLGMATPPLKSNERLYGLKAQVLHKEVFINSYVPKNARIHFIGHSIGAYIILELLRIQSIQSQVVKSYFLFPTIERMAQSPNGKLLTHFVSNFVWLLVFLSWLFTFLPRIIQWFLIKIYIVYYSVDPKCYDSIVSVIKPGVLSKAFYMAVDEMHVVRERNNRALLNNRDKVKFYYGAADRWVPRHYCDELKADFRGIDAEICTRNLDHAFVLRHSVPVGKMVVEWISKDH